MSVSREPKMEPEDACEPDDNELRSSPVVGPDNHFEVSVSAASATIEAKDEIEEDVWEAVDDGPLAAETQVGSERKCFILVFCSIYTAHDALATTKGECPL